VHPVDEAATPRPLLPSGTPRRNRRSCRRRSCSSPRRWCRATSTASCCRWWAGRRA